MSRRIDDLVPIVAGLCKRLRSLSKERGIGLIVTSTLRTEAEQLALFSQGRKALPEVNRLRAEAGLGPITGKENRAVTRALTSMHQFGCAFDVAIVEGGKAVWEAERYEEVGRIGESLGLKWGGRFKFGDYCHFEHRGGLTLSELRAGKRPGISERAGELVS